MKCPWSGGQNSELEVSSGAVEGQGLVDCMEALRLSCLHVLGAVAAVTRRDECGRRLRAQQGGWTGAWLERAGLDQGNASSGEEGHGRVAGNAEPPGQQ